MIQNRINTFFHDYFFFKYAKRGFGYLPMLMIPSSENEMISLFEFWRALKRTNQRDHEILYLTTYKAHFFF